MVNEVIELCGLKLKYHYDYMWEVNGKICIIQPTRILQLQRMDKQLIKLTFKEFKKWIETDTETLLGDIINKDA